MMPVRAIFEPATNGTSIEHPATVRVLRSIGDAQLATLRALMALPAAVGPHGHWSPDFCDQAMGTVAGMCHDAVDRAYDDVARAVWPDVLRWDGMTFAAWANRRH